MLINIGFGVLLTALNLRGVRESGRAFATPTYAFVASVLIMIVNGFVRTFTGSTPVAESAGWDVHPEQVGGQFLDGLQEQWRGRDQAFGVARLVRKQPSRP